MSERGAIVRDHGMGGFLCPPLHPMHNYEVQTDLRRRRKNRSSMSLEYALTCEWLHEDTKNRVRGLLAGWEDSKPTLDAPEVQEWILQVLGYFRGCYRGAGPEPECWNVSNLRIPKKGEPAISNEEHAGVHLIRKYYPEYQVNAAHFEAACWGTKPQVA